jgi:hypothetical protein
MHDLQSPLDPVEPNVNTVNPLGLCHEVTLEQGDLALKGGNAFAQVSQASPQLIDLVVDPPQIDRNQVVRPLAHSKL